MKKFAALVMALLIMSALVPGAAFAGCSATIKFRSALASGSADGVVYTLYVSTGSGYAKVGSQASYNGTVKFTGVAQGSYMIAASSLNGYSLNGLSIIYATVSKSLKVTYYAGKGKALDNPGFVLSKPQTGGYSFSFSSYIAMQGQVEYMAGFSYSVYYESQGSYFFWKTVTCSDSGSAVVTGCAPGIYFIKPDEQSPYQPISYPEGVYCEVKASGSYSFTYKGIIIQNVSFGYSQSMSITVGGSYNSPSGAQMLGGASYALYRASFESSYEYLYSVTASSGGYSTFENVPYGNYIVKAVSSGKAALASSSYIEVSVSESGCVFTDPGTGKKTNSYCFEFR